MYTEFHDLDLFGAMMPFADIDEAKIYYETFGQDAPGRAPLLLIHSATRTGHATWEHAAPRLAQHYRVIVPDCRGHGQSSNPHGTYSFSELAADAAGLVRALGYERAHVIGHSNGGNVALVTLMEHPEIVQTCVIQAGNAWVSPDLIEREPPIYEPERIAREDPQWMAEMIALHGPTHGPDYWRELVRLTVGETIREPNYTPADLDKVSRPVLVIEGEKDRVNGTYAHGQFIADNIPGAKLWRPAGVGHHVHDEILDEWLARVLDFLARRGGDPSGAKAKG
jgi:pimeloyl-ACP methyl ester carboxylesterase